MKLVMVDLGCGNVGSVAIAFERFGLWPRLTSFTQEIEEADKVILPGVGAAGFAMAQMRARGLEPVLRRLRQPVLGICLGMQLLFERSEEDSAICLGIVPGAVRRLEPAPGRPVPHMGWSRLAVRDDNIGLSTGDYVYFAHSFACDEGATIVAHADYGRLVPAVVQKANWTGVQFHPEKSGEAGAHFLRAWLDA